MNGIRFPFALSLAGHAIFLALLILFAMKAPSLPVPTATGGIEVAIAPSLPQPPAPPAPPAPPKIETPPPPPPAPPPPKVEAPLPPPPPAVETPSPAVISEPPPPPPPRKPAFRPVARPVARRPVPAEPPPAAPIQPPPEAGIVPPAAAGPPAVRAPAPAPAPAISPGYRALLSAWLESHKQYPESARERGEEGRAVLRFAVDRSGRVIDYAVVSSSGYPDLDAALENMMRGATLPPFPADMTQPSIAVAVTIRFALGR